MQDCFPISQWRRCSQQMALSQEDLSARSERLLPRQPLTPELLQWIIISALFVRPTAQQGTDSHLESSQSQAGTSATFTRAGAGSHSPRGYVCKSH